MKVSVKDRVSSAVSCLHKGDIFVEGGEFWEVMAAPESHAQGITTIRVKRIDGSALTRSRAYDYHSEHRVKLAYNSFRDQ